MFSTVALLFYRICKGGAVVLCGFVQDVLPVGVGIKSLQRRIDRVALKWWKSFDWIMPISEKIAEDFCFRNGVVIVKGGVTSEALRQWDAVCSEKITVVEPCFVFAGALESYNGIDQLIVQWIKQEVPYVLHVYGIGSLTSLLNETAKQYKNIIFHGRVSHMEVLRSCANSRGAFCLRYSDGINAEYFFPSKFFELLVSPVAVLVNRFPGLNDDLIRGCEVLKDDLSNLGVVLQKIVLQHDIEGIQARRRIAREMYLYRSCINRLTERICVEARARSVPGSV